MIITALNNGSPGEPFTLNVANPAAGAVYSQAVPAGLIWRIASICFTFATAAAVANRIVLTQFTDAAANVLASTGDQSNQVASLTVRYTHGRIGTTLISTSGNRTFGLVDMYLLPGWIVQASIANIQAADQMSAIYITGERWRL